MCNTPLNGQWTGYETLRRHPLGKFCGVNADHSRMDITMLCEKLRKLSPERLETVHPDVELHPNRLLEYYGDYQIYDPRNVAAYPWCHRCIPYRTSNTPRWMEQWDDLYHDQEWDPMPCEGPGLSDDDAPLDEDGSSSHTATPGPVMGSHHRDLN